jgi:hypothetical protein
LYSSLMLDGQHPYRGLGLLAGSDFMALRGNAAFAGQTVHAGDQLIRYTWMGDANLDGVITADDYAQLDEGYLFGLSGWVYGDSDYSGAVTATDYAAIARAGAQAGPLGEMTISSEAVLSDEPTSAPETVSNVELVGAAAEMTVAPTPAPEVIAPLVVTDAVAAGTDHVDAGPVATTATNDVANIEIAARQGSSAADITPAVVSGKAGEPLMALRPLVWNMTGLNSAGDGGAAEDISSDWTQRHPRRTDLIGRVVLPTGVLIRPFERGGPQAPLV